MGIIAVVPTKGGKFFVATAGDKEGKTFKKPAQALRWVMERKPLDPDKDAVLAVMGGSGKGFLGRLAEVGMRVEQTPMYKLQECSELAPGASAQERAIALLGAWENNQTEFYPLGVLNQDMMMARELCRQRLAIQELRKMATLQMHSALRDLEFVLPEEAGDVVNLLRKGLKEFFRKPATRELIADEFSRLEREVNITDLQQGRLLSVRLIFTNPRFVIEAKEEEEEIEKRIEHHLRHFPIWHWLKVKNSVLPLTYGLGPSLGGSVISEIGDITRFPSPNALRAYARFHLNEGKFPRRKKKQVSPWNEYLHRAVWLWSTDQVTRWNHPWRELYLWKKACEMQSHPEPIPRIVKDQNGRERIVYDYTLKHLHHRAARWTGSQLLEYLWHLWREVDAGRDPGEWYGGSSWPSYFAGRTEALNSGLRAYLEAEIPKRRRVVKSDEDEESDGDEEEADE